MSFLIILLCVGLERIFLMEPFLQREAWFNYYFKQVGRILPLKWQQQHYGILLFLIPLILFVVILHTVSDSYFSKVSPFLFESIILLYCLGPIDIYHTGETIPQNIFERAHTSLFAVLFWFALLGPIGALVFRLLSQIASIPTTQSNLKVAERVTVVAPSLVGYLNWLPIRFFIGIQVVFGTFPDTFRYWLDHLLTGWMYNSSLATHSGYIALNIPIGEPLGSHQYSQALRLFDKILLVFLGMLCVSTIAIWMI